MRWIVKPPKGTPNRRAHLSSSGPAFSRNSALYYAQAFPEYIRDFARWVQEGKLVVKVDRVYPLSQAAEAQAAFEQRQTIGRVLLMP